MEFCDAPYCPRAGQGSRRPEVELSEIAAAALDALEAVGFLCVEDHNRPGAVGAGRSPMSSYDGRRVTTADAFLPVGRTPANLIIRADAQVADIVFDDTRAVGIRLLDGAVIEAGWVVLCAGVYGSPAILMRSGIGPADHLRSLGIPVRLDLPGVGANLADHAGVDIDCGYRGAARAAPILHLIATFHTTLAASDDAPDMMLWLSDPRGDPPIFEIDIVLLRPRARGTVRLRSRDPAEPPLIQLPDRCDPIDIQRLAEGYFKASTSRPNLGSEASVPPRRHGTRDSRPNSGTSSVPTPTTSRTLPVPARWARRLTLGGRRRLGSSARHRRGQRGRRLDRAQRSIRVHPPPDGHARRASLRAACRSPVTKSAVRCGRHPRRMRAQT